MDLVNQVQNNCILRHFQNLAKMVQVQNVISQLGYNRRRNSKLGLTELYGNTE